MIFLTSAPEVFTRNRRNDVTASITNIGVDNLTTSTVDQDLTIAVTLHSKHSRRFNSVTSGYVKGHVCAHGVKGTALPKDRGC